MADFSGVTGGIAKTPAGTSKGKNSASGKVPGASPFSGVTGGIAKVNNPAKNKSLGGGHPSPGGFSQKHVGGSQPPAGRGGATKAGS